MLEIRIAACVIMLLLASIVDLKKREISDKIWIGFGGFGILLTALELNGGSANILRYVLPVGITAPIAYGIYRTALFGGADAKALVAISLLLPFYDMTFKIHGITALTVLTNAAILTCTQVVYNAARNFIEIAKGRAIFEGFEESKARKALAFMMGFRTSRPKGFLFAMESSEGGKRKFIFHPARYDEFVASNSRSIWVTPALPFIVYMTFGFALMIIFGDLLAVIFANI